MDEQAEVYMQKYPKSVVDLFLSLRQTIYDSVTGVLTEKMWARMANYSIGDKFVRLIPFQDHINMEAQAILQYKEELSEYKITPRGMLQIYLVQNIQSEVLIRIFAKT
ncbi:MAG: DUF1801 domain-containing protein [Eubacteriales bacterium]|nr:DUF1801 domain-containing protein [Eubacteriales bacterium]